MTKYLWDGVNLLAETIAWSGVPPAPRRERRKTRSPRVVGLGLADVSRGDALSTINRLTDASEAVTDLYVLDAWGRSVSSSGSTANPFRYVGSLGYYTEPDLGLDYVRARWLRPATGSWVSVDPVLTEPRYGYVRGRPRRTADAAGRDSAVYRAHRGLCRDEPAEPTCSDDAGGEQPPDYGKYKEFVEWWCNLWFQGCLRLAREALKDCLGDEPDTSTLIWCQKMLDLDVAQCEKEATACIDRGLAKIPTPGDPKKRERGVCTWKLTYDPVKNKWVRELVCTIHGGPVDLVGESKTGDQSLAIWLNFGGGNSTGRLGPKWDDPNKPPIWGAEGTFRF